MKRILTVLGARPQFIKASVVSYAIAAADAGATGPIPAPVRCECTAVSKPFRSSKG